MPDGLQMLTSVRKVSIAANRTARTMRDPTLAAAERATTSKTMGKCAQCCAVAR